MDFSKFDITEKCKSIEGHIIVLRYGSELASAIGDGSEPINGPHRKYVTVLGKTHTNILLVLFMHPFLSNASSLSHFLLPLFPSLTPFTHSYFLFFFFFFFPLFLISFSPSPFPPFFPCPPPLPPSGLLKKIRIYLQEPTLSTFLLMGVLIIIKVGMGFWGLCNWLLL